MSKSKKTSILIFVFIFLTLMSISAKSRKNDEKRFQLGFGFTASSANVFNFIQSFKMSADGNYGELTVDGTGNNLNGASKQALVTSNMLASMEIGFQMRILAHVFFSELDLVAEPMVNIGSGHCDFLVMYDIGIRCPKWVMPYIAVGINGTFSLYPDNIANIQKWRQSLGNANYYNNNFMITLGAHAKVGLDVKFKRFSVGFYCLYLIKDVINDWTDTLPNYYKELKIAAEDKDIYGTMFFVASQFRLGASICWYAF